MAAKHPSKIPKNLKVYIDTNIFHLYLREPQGPTQSLHTLLEKVEKGEAQGYTSTLVLDELLYKLLLKKIEEPYGEKPFKILKNNRKAVQAATSYARKGLEIVLAIENLEILPVKTEHLQAAAHIMEKYSLLPRDAVHIAVMRENNIQDIASADTDFDTINNITRWTPIQE